MSDHRDSPDDIYSDVDNKNTVSAYFTSKQILPFGFAELYCWAPLFPSLNIVYAGVMALFSRIRQYPCLTFRWPGTLPTGTLPTSKI